MKFTIQRESILKPLQLVSGVVERRQTLPILSNVLVDVEPGGLIVTATDLELELVLKAPLDGSESGRTTIPARKFTEICRALPDGAVITLHLDRDRVVIQSGRSRFILATLPAEEFPNAGEIRPFFEFSIEQDKLRKLLERTSFAMAQQDVRYYLNGLLLEASEDNLRSVATDGHRLAYCQEVMEKRISEPHQIIIPRKGALELIKLLAGDNKLVYVELAVNHIKVSNEEMSFISKLVDGRFPDYQRVMPQNPDKLVVAERESLRQALVRASILSNEKYRSVRLQFSPGSVRVLAHNPEQEEAEEEIAAQYEGDEVEIGFNASYLLDALSAVNSSMVELHLSDPNSCCLIKATGSDNCKYVVMPMRL